MAKHGWKTFVMAGLLGLTGLAVGCNDRRDTEVREEVREDAIRADPAVDDAASSMESIDREAAEELREGTGGAGNLGAEDVDIGEREGVINDGEGAFERPDTAGGEDNPVRDGVGPLEENTDKKNY
jgi:hypothetical protein